MKRHIAATAMMMAVLISVLAVVSVSAAPPPGQTAHLQQLTSLGSATFSNTPAGSAALSAHEFFVGNAGGDARFALRAQPTITRFVNRPIPHTQRLSLAPTTATLAVPKVKGWQVDQNSGESFSGFNGLTHYDQRTANNGNQFSLEPPDQALCVGNGYVVESVNDVVRVYDQAGNPKTGVQDLNTFFGLPAQIVRTTPPVYGPFLSDPRCHFDTQTKRWFLTTLEIDVDPVTGGFLNHAHTLIAVSKSNNPTGAWYLYSLDSTDDGTNGTPNNPGCPCFGDQPLSGLDANGFYITTNEFSIAGSAFNGAQVYAMSKWALAAGKPSTVVHIGNLPLAEGVAYSLQPATSPSPESMDDRAGHGTEYFLSALDFNANLDNRIAVWAMTNTQSLKKATPDVTLTSAVLSSEVYGQPPNADQKAGPTPLRDCLAVDCLGLGVKASNPLEQLNTNDDRMNQVVFANGMLFGAVNSIVNVNGKTQAGIAAFGVQPQWKNGTLGGAVKVQGYVAVKGNNVLFPSIGVTSDGNAAMVFTLSGKDYYPSVAYISGGLDEGIGSIHIAGKGKGPEDGFSGYQPYSSGSPARWGDYSAATVSGNSIWIAGEYIPAKCTSLSCGTNRTVLANWGTFVGHIKP